MFILVIKYNLLIKQNEDSYNFSRSIKYLDVSGQGQPLTINREVFKNASFQNGFFLEAGAYDGEFE